MLNNSTSLDYTSPGLYEKNLETGRDIWNGQLKRHLLTHLMPDSPDFQITQREYKAALFSLQKLTGILQPTQRALYGVRRTHILSKEMKERSYQVIAIRCKRLNRQSHTLSEAWRLPYVKPVSRRKTQSSTRFTRSHPRLPHSPNQKLSFH